MGHALIDVTSGGDVLIDLILVVDDLHVLCYMFYIELNFIPLRIMQRTLF
jgi:hypothetical protein